MERYRKHIQARHLCVRSKIRWAWDQRNKMIMLTKMHYNTGKCFTCFTKTFANLTTYSRKPGNYNGTIIFEIDIMKNSSPLNLKFTLFAMSKPKQQFFSAGLTALSAQLRVNQNKRNNQNHCEKVKFDKDLNWLGMSFSWYQSQR